MADTDAWDVVIEEPVDRADPRSETERTAIVKKTEVEARQAFAEGISIAEQYGYRSIVLRKNGVAAESWPTS